MGTVMQWFTNIYLLYINFSTVDTRGLPLSGGRMPTGAKSVYR